nr:hypothetical protein [Pseudoalteromonas sp.]
MLADKQKLAAVLAQLDINYDVIEHPALHGSLDADELMVNRPGTRFVPHSHLTLVGYHPRRH